MFVSIGVKKEADRDMMRIERTTPPELLGQLRLCAALLVRWLQFDPHDQGDKPTQLAIRRLRHGPLIVFFTVRPAEDRYAEIIGWTPAPGWEP